MKPQKNGGVVQVLLDIRARGRGVEDDFPSILPFVVPPGMGLECARENGDKYDRRRHCRKSGEKKPAHYITPERSVKRLRASEQRAVNSEQKRTNAAGRIGSR